MCVCGGGASGRKQGRERESGADTHTQRQAEEGRRLDLRLIGGGGGGGGGGGRSKVRDGMSCVGCGRHTLRERERERMGELMDCG